MKMMMKMVEWKTVENLEIFLAVLSISSFTIKKGRKESFVGETMEKFSTNK